MNRDMRPRDAQTVDPRAGRSFHATAGPSLIATFLDSARRHSERPALVVGDEISTYGALAERAGRIAARLAAFPRSEPRLGAVFASRRPAAYDGVLATLLSGAGYVPLNPKSPDDRLASMLAASGASTLVGDEECLSRLGGLLAKVTKPLLVVLPHASSVQELAADHPLHTFVGAADLDATVVPLTDAPTLSPDAIAYVIFTSGSTGVPKGVMVTNQNIVDYLGIYWDRYALCEEDRVSQAFELSFDASVCDIFGSLGRGATLHVVPAKALLSPTKFIQERALTVWFSVPSVPMMMRSFNLLQPGIFPTLRLSLFGGERVPAAIAAAWQAAAPRSRIDILYGPTEATICCTAYTWKDESSASECVDGCVPIGVTFPGTAAAVVDDEHQLVRHGERGELVVRGPLVTPGYWADQAKTDERYVAMPWAPGPDNRWFRTGDLATMREDGMLVHCGRIDEQVKLHGHRIELGEIEHVLKDITQSDFVAVVAHPRDENGGPRGLVAAIARTPMESLAILQAAKKRLPANMVPQILLLPDLPLSSNGKIDKKALVEILVARDRDAKPA